MFKLTPFIGIILLLGCQTGYHAGQGSLTGGFSDKKLDHRRFYVHFSGNGYTSGTRAYELALTRCSELCLENGFNYYRIIQNQNEVDTSTAVYSGSVISTGYGSGFTLGTSQRIPKPVSSITIECFVDKPNFKNYENAKKQIFRAENTYSINVDILESEYDIMSFEKEVSTYIDEHAKPLILKNSGRKELQVAYNNEKSSKSFGLTQIISFTHIDNPFTESKELIDFFSKYSERLGADLLVLIDDDDLLKAKVPNPDNGYPNLSIGFYRKTPAMGVIFEPSLLKNQIYQIRDFTGNSSARESGLKFGDKILNVDQIDVLSGKAFDFSDKKAGDIVNLRVIRNGEETFIKVPLKNYW